MTKEKIEQAIKLAAITYEKGKTGSGQPYKDAQHEEVYPVLKELAEKNGVIDVDKLFGEYRADYIMNQIQDILKKAEGINSLSDDLSVKLNKDDFSELELPETVSGLGNLAEKRKLTEAAEVAKLIRLDLKKEFPTTKFKVWSENYAGGDSVDIEYTDGPLMEELRKIVDKYQMGDFDGMTDMYVYREGEKDHPTVKYVEIQRRMSDEINNQIRQKLIKMFGIENEKDNMEWKKKTGDWDSTKIWQEFSKMNLSGLSEDFSELKMTETVSGLGNLAEKRKLTEAAEVAKLIRLDLKKEFPTTKFKVWSENYAGGDSVDIEYTDGPLMEELRKIVDKYQMGDFDGMTDMYVYREGEKDHPTVKYVQIQRRMSDEINNQIRQKLIKMFGIENEKDNMEWKKKTGDWDSTKIWQEFSKMNLSGLSEDFSELKMTETVPDLGELDQKQLRRDMLELIRKKMPDKTEIEILAIAREKYNNSLFDMFAAISGEDAGLDGLINELMRNKNLSGLSNIDEQLQGMDDIDEQLQGIGDIDEQLQGIGDIDEELQGIDNNLSGLEKDSGLWIQEAVAEHKGAFKEQAKAAGMTTKAFMRQVLIHPDEYESKTVKRARLMKKLLSFHEKI